MKLCIIFIILQDLKTNKLLKRKPPAYKPSTTQIKNKQSSKDRSRGQQSSTVTSSKAKDDGELATTNSPGSRTIKRSVPAEKNNDSPSHQNTDDTLVRQLSAAKYQDS